MAPLTRKWSVVPQSEMAYFTALVTFDSSKMVAAFGGCCKLFACVRVFHVFELVDLWDVNSHDWNDGGNTDFKLWG